jgi:hypothetical protein
MTLRKRSFAAKCVYSGLLCFLGAGMAEASTVLNLSTGFVPYTITSDSITQAPDSGYTGTAIFVTSLPTGAFAHAASATDGIDSTTQWVGPNANQSTETTSGPGVVTGNVTYTVSFNLTGLNAATASLILTVGSDDFVGSITLNSTPIFTPTNPEKTGGMWTIPNEASVGPVTSGFLPGLNTITFVVDNSTGDGSTSCCGPTGLIAAVDVTASAVPEPGTLGVTGLGLAGLTTLLRRRRMGR